MHSTRVKVCGITRPEDAIAAADAGVAAIGLVFVERSPRCVDFEQARRICATLPGWLSVVGLFMDATADYVDEALSCLPLNWLQFHGSESEAYCRSFGRPYIKAVAMAGDTPDWSDFSSATALLLDAHAPGQQGGSGATFNWKAFTPPERPWILAGGLNVHNVASAMALMKPNALDVSSGVESAPGIKDKQLMNEFMQVIRHG